MRPILRLLPIGLLAAAVAVLGPSSLAGAQGIGGLNTNSPVQIAADQIELQDKANRVNLTGDVVITQGDLTLRAPRTTIAYTNPGKLEIQRLDATGGVTVTRGNESASGAVAVYDFNRRLITMSGGVTLRRGSDTLHGGRLVIDLRTGLSSVDGNAGGRKAGGRVTGTFTVPK
jgi:lipopolysaccharide export system protein LptA